MIALIDYGSGNLMSVGKALEHVGADVRIASNAGALSGACAVVLPGVGSFGDCVRNLRASGLWEPLSQWLGSGKPFLGICLGYQMLFEGSEETPGVDGFGFFKGRVVRFPDREGLKVPHMGWNNLALTQPAHPLWEGLPPEPYVYFVHSYYPDPDDPKIVSARCEYGVSFAAAVCRENVMACQFHPEKSQETGLAILRNFVGTLGPKTSLSLS